MASKISPNSPASKSQGVQHLDTSRGNESKPSPMVMRVKRRISESPAEAILLLDSVSKAKRLKTESTNNFNSSTKGKARIFRFAATLTNQKYEKNTKDLVFEMLEKTKKEIDVKKRKNFTAHALTSTKKSTRLSDACVKGKSKDPSKKSQTIDITTLEASAHARYHVVQSKRNLPCTNIVKDDDDCNSECEKSTRLKVRNGEQESGERAKVNKVENDSLKQLKELGHLCDIETDESYNISHGACSKKPYSNLPTKCKLNHVSRNIEEEEITCNGVKPREVIHGGLINESEDSEYVYDLYCHISQETPCKDTGGDAKNYKEESHNTEVNNLAQNSEDNISNDAACLPDFQSTFGEATTNIIGCKWESAQQYLTTDLSDDGMPSWWHRGGDIDTDFLNEDVGLDDSEDSNAEDNWMNDYPDEKEFIDEYDYDDEGDELENEEIHGFDTLRLNDFGTRAEESDVLNEDSLVYTIDENAEFIKTSDRHGEAYAKYKRRINTLLGEDDDDQDSDEFDEELRI